MRGYINFCCRQPENLSDKFALLLNHLSIDRAASEAAQRFDVTSSSRISFSEKRRNKDPASCDLGAKNASF
jgi:hypothetical protein